MQYCTTLQKNLKNVTKFLFLNSWENGFLLAKHGKEESEKIGKAVYKENLMLKSHDLSIYF